VFYALYIFVSFKQERNRFREESLPDTVPYNSIVEDGVAVLKINRKVSDGIFFQRIYLRFIDKGLSIEDINITDISSDNYYIWLINAHMA
jgi:hypothetical protein